MSQAVPITSDPDPAVPGELITYGHSFLAEQGLSDPTGYYGRLVAASLGLTYPTSRGGRTDDLKRAVGGSLIRETAVRALGQPLPPHPGGAALVIAQGLINSARLNGASPADVATARTSLRTLMAVVNAASRIDVSDTDTFAFSGSWLATAATPAGNADIWRQTFRSGECFDATFPPGDAYLVFAGTNSESPPTVAVTDLNNAGTTINTFRLGDGCVSSSAWAPYAYRAALTARGHRLRFTPALGTGPLAVCALYPQLLAPSPVLMMKEPYLPDYTASTMFPHGSDAALDAFNALIDDVAVEFPNIIVADPNQPGYWNKLLHTQPDQVHPNEAGNAALARTALDALDRRAQSAARSASGKFASS